MSNTHIVFHQPCHEDWDRITPSDRSRHCQTCDKPVHDLALYSPEEADELLKAGPTPACVRAQILPDGRVLTRPGRTGKFLTAAIAAPVLFVAMAAAASPSGPTAGAISGVVGGIVPNQRVTAVGEGVRRSVRIESNGHFRLRGLPPGRYNLTFYGPHAVPWHVDDVEVRSGHETVRDVTDTPEFRVPSVPTAGMPAVVPAPAPAVRTTAPAPSAPAFSQAAQATRSEEPSCK